jgi:hypothetical protein
MDKEAIARIAHGAMRWAADNSCTDKHPEWQGGNSFAEDEARKAATDILATLSPAEPSPESREDFYANLYARSCGDVLRVRAETIEECAKVAETLPIGGGTLSSWINTNESPMGATRRHIASAIRALSAPAHD